MNKYLDCLKVIEVENKLSGGVSNDDFNPIECPWCGDGCHYDNDEDYTDDQKTEFAACDSCDKQWVVVYKRSHYERIRDKDRD